MFFITSPQILAASPERYSRNWILYMETFCFFSRECKSCLKTRCASWDTWLVAINDVCYHSLHKQNYYCNGWSCNAGGEWYLVCLSVFLCGSCSSASKFHWQKGGDCLIAKSPCWYKKLSGRSYLLPHPIICHGCVFRMAIIGMFFQDGLTGIPWSFRPNLARIICQFCCKHLVFLCLDEFSRLLRSQQWHRYV